MNLNTAIALLLPAVVGTTTVALTAEDLAAVYAEGTAKAAWVQEQNDKQLLEAARLMYEMDTGKRGATEQELVAAGYLKPEFLTREAVQR